MNDIQHISELIGHDLGSRTVTYDERDAMLYALAVGASADDIELVYEQHLRVLPTFALPLGLWAVEAAAATGAYDRTSTLHVGQQLSMKRHLQPRDHLEMSGRVTGVWDKGKAAVIDIQVSCEAFDATYVIFAPGAGGFGGERGPARSGGAPERDPDVTTRVATGRDQAVLYRLTGDRHPVHVDPDVAKSVGFDRPILHGLCTLGCAVRELATQAGRNPADITEVATRFVAPVYPGDTVELAGWREGDDLRFTAESQGAAVLADGILS